MRHMLWNPKWATTAMMATAFAFVALSALVHAASHHYRGNSANTVTEVAQVATLDEAENTTLPAGGENNGAYAQFTASTAHNRHNAAVNPPFAAARRPDYTVLEVAVLTELDSAIGGGKNENARTLHFFTSARRMYAARVEGAWTDARTRPSIKGLA